SNSPSLCSLSLEYSANKEEDTRRRNPGSKCRTSEPREQRRLTPTPIRPTPESLISTADLPHLAANQTHRQAAPTHEPGARRPNPPAANHSPASPSADSAAMAPTYTISAHLCKQICT